MKSIRYANQWRKIISIERINDNAISAKLHHDGRHFYEAEFHSNREDRDRRYFELKEMIKDD